MKKQIATLALLLLAAGLVSARDVVEWRNDRTGIYPEEGLLKAWPSGGPALLWSYEGLGEGYSSPTVSGGKMYLTGMTDGRGYLYAFDLSGKLLAKKEYGPEWDESYGGTRGSVVPHGGKLYVVSGRGSVLCFDQKDLSVVWQRSYTEDYGGQIPKYGVNESPLVVGEMLILTPGGKEHNIVAVNKHSGSLMWTSAAKGDISSYCSPIFLADQQVPQLVTMTGHHVVGLNVADGKLLWAFPFTNRFFEHPNTPVYGGDNLLLCTSSYKVGSVMLRLTNGGRAVEQVWAAPQLDVRTGHMLKVGSYAYGAGDYKKGWYCVDWKTGRQLYEDRSLPAGAIVAADGMLYCYSDNGTLALVRATPQKFDVAGRLAVAKGSMQHWAHPVIYKGVLYVRHGSALMAYSIKE